MRSERCEVRRKERRGKVGQVGSMKWELGANEAIFKIRLLLVLNSGFLSLIIALSFEETAQ